MPERNSTRSTNPREIWDVTPVPIQPLTNDKGQALWEGLLALSFCLGALFFGGRVLWKSFETARCQRKLILEVRREMNVRDSHSPSQAQTLETLGLTRVCPNGVLVAKWPRAETFLRNKSQKGRIP